MLYQLQNGKTVKITEEQFFRMTDQDLKDLEGSSYGYMINDPFIDSILGDDLSVDSIEEIDVEKLEEIDPDFLDVDE